MGPHTDPGPSSSAQVSKWSVRPWVQNTGIIHFYIWTHLCYHLCCDILSLAIYL
ncbi:unnamed protein product [Staurois parvus]|uniref:Uncharacterized protein n=1 Tax=Staurois parvus TaxID=386267 RepID=A0ABN9HM34_9NEOB|nr:unnamed protein product [Staurois parvus]